MPAQRDYAVEMRAVIDEATSHGPYHPDGWQVDRDEPATPGWPGGRRPELRTNLEDPK